MEQAKCKDKVEGAFESRMGDIRHLFKAEGGKGYYCEDCDEYANDFTDTDENDKDILQCFYCDGRNVIDIEAEIGRLCEYGLCIDLVEAGTFKDQREDYVRYQLSWGGPTEEFRVYKNGDVEFWYLDWGDGACVDVTGDDADIIKEIIGLSFPDFVRV